MKLGGTGNEMFAGKLRESGGMDAQVFWEAGESGGQDA